MRLNKTEFAIFISLMWSLLPKDLTNNNLFIFTAAGVVPGGGRKTSPFVFSNFYAKYNKMETSHRNH